MASGLLAILIVLLPTGTLANALPAPNLLLAVLFFWTVRRPAAVPPLIVFALGLFQDLTRTGPLGAEVLALILATETGRLLASRDTAPGPLLEWMRFALAAVLYECVVLVLLLGTFVPGIPIGDMILRMLLSLLIYPIIVLIFGWGLGIRWQDAQRRGYI